MSESLNLYDANGSPVGYVADDQSTIYLWHGQPVAYLHDDKVYGWNGSHLGWWRNGVIHDMKGLKTGFARQRCPSACQAAPAKSARQARPAKAARHAAYAAPAMSTGYNNDLLGYLQQGVR